MKKTNKKASSFKRKRGKQALFVYGIKTREGYVYVGETNSSIEELKKHLNTLKYTSVLGEWLRLGIPYDVIALDLNPKVSFSKNEWIVTLRHQGHALINGKLNWNRGNNTGSVTKDYTPFSTVSDGENLRKIYMDKYCK